MLIPRLLCPLLIYISMSTVETYERKMKYSPQEMAGSATMSARCFAVLQEDKALAAFQIFY